MTTDEFESMVSQHFGEDAIDSFEHDGDESLVTFVDGAKSSIDRKSPTPVSESIFVLTDVAAGLDASEPLTEAWSNLIVSSARQVMIGKLMFDGSWDND